MSKAKDLMKRQRILQAAGRIFSQKGFSAAKISEIAREADVADGTIYLYFQDKSDLLNAVFESNLETLTATTTKELRAGTDALSKLHILIDTHMRFFGEHPDLCRVFQAEIQQNLLSDSTNGKNPRLQEYLKILVELVSQGQTDGSIRQDLQPWLVQRVLFGGLSDLALNAPKAAGKAPAWKEAAEQAYHLFLGGLTTQTKVNSQRSAA